MSHNLERSATFTTNAINDEERTVTLSFSSEEPFTRGGGFFGQPWTEVLGHREREVDLGRLNNGAAVLYNHDSSEADNHIGVVERAWLDGDKGRAVVRFGTDASSDKVFQKVKDGILKNVSVGYRILKRKLVDKTTDPRTYRVTKWAPHELSFVPIPADPFVGVGRNIDEVDTMPEEMKTPESAPVEERQDESKTDLLMKRLEQEREAAAIEERARCAKIREMVKTADIDPQLADALVADGSSVEDAQRKIWEAWRIAGPQVPNGIPSAQVQADAVDKFAKGAEAALLARAGLGDDDAANNYRDYNLQALLRESFRLKGHDHLSIDDMLARMHSTSNFPNITANVANNALMAGFNEANATWQWMQTGNLSDFKQALRTDFGGFENLPEVHPGGEVKYTTTLDRGENIQLATYAAKFQINRQTIINDDIGAFTRIPRNMGEAAAGTVNDTAYKALLADDGLGPDMSDGVALFNAAHNNIDTAAAPSTNSVSSMRTLMMLQRLMGVDDSAGRRLNIPLSYLIVPPSLASICETIRASQFAVTTDAETSAATAPNIEQGRFMVVVESILEDISSTAWFGASNRQTIEVAFLNGRQSPTLQRIENTNILGVEWLIYIDVGAAPMDWRGLVRNAGA